MKRRILAPVVAALAGLLLVAPLAFAGASIGASASVSASVNVKLAPAPGGLFLVGKPAVPVVRPHRITMGLMHGGVYRTRVFGLAPGGVVYLGARARPYVLVGAPVAVVSAPGVVVGSPGAVVGAPGVVVGAPGVVVGAPAVVVGVSAPAVVVGGPRVVVGASPVVVVGGGGKHDHGRHKGHHKGGKRH